MASGSAPSEALANFGLEVTAEIIGEGAYGVVHKAKFLGSDCVVKVIRTLTAYQESQPALIKFEQECHFMNKLRHSNIVQCFGTARLRFPVLVMELMDCNLNSYLENNLLHLHTEIDIADDIIKGLRYLHHEGIVHRDLSGANILMKGSRAKVSDLGMAKLLSVFQSSQLTRCPGNAVYMPRNALQNHPCYNEKIDLFSYGVLVVQIVTKELPNPSQEWYKVVPTDDIIRYPGGTINVYLTEIERRENHIGKIDDQHPLKEVACVCLQDEQNQRPSAEMIQAGMKSVKELQLYQEDLQKSNMQIVKLCDMQQLYDENRCLYVSHSVKDKEIQELQVRVGQLELEFLGIGQEVSDRLKQQKEAMNQEYEQKFAERVEQEKRGLQKELETFYTKLQQEIVFKNAEELQYIKNREAIAQERETAAYQQAQAAIQHEQTVTQQARAALEQAGKEVILAQEREAMATQKSQEREAMATQKAQETQGTLLAKIDEIERSASFCSSASNSVNESLISASQSNTNSNLVFHIAPSAPRKMHQDSSAVVYNEAIYVRPARTKIIYKYFDRHWSIYAQCIMDYSTLAVVQNHLTTIGGQTCNPVVKFSGALYSLVSGSGNTAEWREELPPMKTERDSVLAISSGKALIVVGGRHKHKRLEVVEVFHEDTRQWQFASSLPFPLHHTSITTFEDGLFIQGMKKSHQDQSVVAFTCKLTDLIFSCSQLSGNVWSRMVADLPLSKCTCIKFNGHLLAIGGQQKDNQPSRAVHYYDQQEEKWIELATLNIHRYLCFAAVLSDSLHVIGGDEGCNSLIESMEIGIFQ